MSLIDEMRAFAAVVEARSITAAAKRLGVGASTISKHLAALEGRFGVTLVNRTTRRLHITEIGESFHGRCIELLETVEQTEFEMAELSFRPKGPLKVTAPPVFAMTYLAPRIPAFLEMHPEIRLDLVLTSENLDLSTHGIDLAIRISGRLDPSTVTAIPLCVSRRVFCAAPGYLSKHGEPRHPHDLQQHNCLVYAGLINNPWPYRDGDQLTDIFVNGNFTANNLEMVRQTAVAGMGVALMPTWLVAPDIGSGALKEILTDFKITPYSVYAVSQNRRYTPVKTHAFIEFLKETFSPVPPWEQPFISGARGAGRAGTAATGRRAGR